MSVYKPKNKSSVYHYDFVFKGVRYYSSTGTANRSEAEGYEEALKTKLRREHFFGAPKTRPAMTVEQAFGRYWEEIGQHTAAPADTLHRGEVVTEAIGKGTPLSEIDDDKLALVVAKLRGRKGRQGNLIANSTVNRFIETYRRVWRRAAKVWKVEVGDEPTWREHLLEEPNERVRELTPDEEAKLFKHLREDMHPMVKFALMSGLRVSNVRKLTWRDVDFQAGAISVRLKSKKPGGRLHTVPLTTSMTVLLANEKGNHPIFVFTYVCAKSRTQPGADGRPVVRTKGKRYPFSRDGWKKGWYAALEKAEIEDFHFHDTRHTAATRTLRASGNIKVVQKMLGHTDITTTARYAHALTDDIRTAMEAAQSRNSPGIASKEPAKKARKTRKNNA